MGAKDILISDLPQKPPFEVALRANSSRIDIPVVCFLCRHVLACDTRKIDAADWSYLRLRDNPELRASEVCEDFLTD